MRDVHAMRLFVAERVGVALRASSRRTVFAVLAIAFMTGVASASLSDEGKLQAILAQGTQGGSGGTYGYYLKQVGGPVALARNEEAVYDPASALKTVILAYAMRQIASGADSLSNQVTVYSYPDNRNHLSASDPNLCPNPVDEMPANSSSLDLRSVLAGMLQVSDNRLTRALELRYGRGNLAAYASNLGMSGTSLNQIFGCGWDNGRRNSWTLADAGRLYEGIVSGTAVPATALDQVLSLLPSGGIDQSTIQEEASALGMPDAAYPFARAAKMFSKGGSYDVCVGSCSTSTYIIRDEAGILTVPFQTPQGQTSTSFVWGSFVANVLASCSSFPCNAGDLAESAVRSSLPELFRPAIRAALQTWGSVTEMTTKPAAYTPNGLVKVSARLGTQYTKKHPAGMTVQFIAARKLICVAKTNISGLATCTGRAPKAAHTYTAKFSGGAGLFGSAGTARIPKPPKKF